MIETLLDVGVFVVFLGLYAAWTAALVWLSGRAQDELSMNQMGFVTREVSLLISYGGIFLLVSLLSRTLDVSWFVGLVVGANIGIVLLIIVWGFLRSPASQWGPGTLLAGAEFGFKHPVLMLAVNAVGLVVLVGYLVAVAIIYFTNTNDLEAAGPDFFKASLLAFFVGGSIILLPFVVSALASEHVDEDTRTLMFVTQASLLIPNALVLSLLFWSFDIPGTPVDFTLGGLSSSFSVLAVALLTAYFVLTVFVPYAMGTTRARKWRLHLVERQKVLQADLVDSLGFPNVQTYADELTDLQSRLLDEKAQLERTERVFDLPQYLPDGPMGERLERALAAVIPHDSRHQYSEFLDELHEEVDSIKAELARKRTAAQKRTTATQYAQVYKERVAGLDKASSRISGSKSALLVGTGALLTPLIAVLQSSIGESIWTEFLEAVGQ